jgi:hypothetical protein
MLLYPQRQRCRACRKYFCFEVIYRLYCSAECAGLPNQPGIMDLPRSCRVFRDGEWVPKRSYRSYREAYRRSGQARNKGRVIYLCDGPDGCGLYHIAKKRASPAPSSS